MTLEPQETKIDIPMRQTQKSPKDCPKLFNNCLKKKKNKKAQNKYSIFSFHQNSELGKERKNINVHSVIITMLQLLCQSHDGAQIRRPQQ